MNFSRFFFRVVVVVAAAAAVSIAVVIFINIIRLLYAIELQSGISHSLPYLWLLANSNNSNSNSKREIRRRNGWIKKTRAYEMPQYRYAHPFTHSVRCSKRWVCVRVFVCVSNRSIWCAIGLPFWTEIGFSPPLRMWLLLLLPNRIIINILFLFPSNHFLLLASALFYLPIGFPFIILLFEPNKY